MKRASPRIRGSERQRSSLREPTDPHERDGKKESARFIQNGGKLNTRHGPYKDCLSNKGALLVLDSGLPAGLFQDFVQLIQLVLEPGESCLLRPEFLNCLRFFRFPFLFSGFL